MESTHELPLKAAETASSAEMKFAGYYLNLGGIVLLLVGLVSFLKSAAPGGMASFSEGTMETGLGALLGIVLLLTGEYLFRREMKQISNPVVTAGFCLLFFVICSAHFRFQLLESGSFFTFLLLVVMASNASVFRFDSKLIGNVMSLVYFTTPLVMTFSFEHFNGLFLYLLSITGGTAVVAWRKKWDFQLVVACLGSYSFFYLHGGAATALQAIALLFMIYILSFVANNTIFFTRPESSSFNLFVSFVNPVAFAAISSSMVMFHFSNWVPVCVFLTLAVGHALVARIADSRRGESQDFQELATNNLLLSLLFLCAGISFVTYFADDTTYFTLVTLLWFGLAHTLLQLGVRVTRYRTLASRFSLFSLALATFQVYFVVASMTSATPLKAVSGLLLVGYYALMCRHRAELSTEQIQFAKGSAFLAVLGGGFLAGSFASQSLTVMVLVVFGTSVLRFSLQKSELSFLVWAGMVLLFFSLWHSLTIWPGRDPFWMLLPATTLLYGLFLLRFKACQTEWLCWAVLAAKCSTMPAYHSEGALLLSLVVAQGVYAGLARFSGREKLFGVFFELTALPVVALLLLSDYSPQMLLAAGAISLLALGQARAWEQELSTSHYLASGAIWGRLFLMVLIPNPLLILLLSAVASVALMRMSKVRASLGFSTLGMAGLALAPFGFWLQGWNLVCLGVVCGAMACSYAMALGRSADYAVPRLEGLACLLLFRWSLVWADSPLSTLAWVVLAAFLLRRSEEPRDWNLLGQGAFDVARFLLFAAFLKSVVWDANFVSQVTSFHFPLSFAVAGCVLLIAHTLVKKPEARSTLVVAGLLMVCFQTTFLLHRRWGDLDLFQPLLSGFWTFTAFGIIAAGVLFQKKAYRLFGLSTMVAGALKILLVDIHVLDAYSQTNTYLILGSLLVSTSLLYQKQRDRLTGEGLRQPTSPHFELG